MATLISCPTCQSRLSLGDNASTPRVRCPKCKTIVTVDEALPEAETIDPGPVSQHYQPPPARPAPAPPPRRERPARDFDSGDDYADDRAQPRRRRRKRRRRSESGGKPVWIWLIFALGALLTLGAAGGTVAWLIHAELMMGAVALGIALAILTPISVVIFILSMVISSAIAGGIDFGEAHWAILKASGLLLVINLVQLIPFAGPWIALVIWVVGLMMLYGLDFWEARFLIIINWILNYIARWIVLAFILSMIMSGKGEDAAKIAGFLDPGSKKPGMTKAEKAQTEAEDRALDMIHEVGGDVIREDNGDITAAMFTNSQVKDDDLKLLKAFKKLGTVELTATQITDKGLAHLKEIKSLKIVGVNSTRVTEAGIQDLKRALPGVTVLK